MKVQFPHFTRKFSASIISASKGAALWAALTALFFFNVYAKINVSPVYWKELEQTLQKPFSAVAHKVLAHSFWQQGFISEAKSELRLSQTLPKTTDGVRVLGASTEDELVAWAAQPEQAKISYDYWKNVVATKPDFRDGYVALASAAYKLGNGNEAKSAAQTALSIDPNNVDIRRLLEFITNAK